MCADDYGLAPGVSEAIRDLVAMGRLTAVSCMTVFPEWPVEARHVAAMAERADIGLHLTLSDAPPLGPMPRTARGGKLPTLGRLLAASHARTLDLDEIEEEIDRQLDAFEAATGRPPDFIDGHRHVHSLPGVRERVAALFERRLDPARTWLRVCSAPTAEMLRRRIGLPNVLLIDRLSRPLVRLARRRGIQTNDGFRGVNRFTGGDVAPLFESWLEGAGTRPLIMCHPGKVDEKLRGRDPVHGPREAEYAYLSGPAFAEALERRGLSLARLLDH